MVKVKKPLRRPNKAIRQLQRFSKWEASSPYFYNAFIAEEDRPTAVYDGDTIRNMRIDMGFGFEWKIPSIRLIGINAPEMRGVEAEKGRISRDYLIGILEKADWKFIVRSHKFKTEKYGRYMFELFVEERNVNLMMVKASMAVVNFYD